MTPKEREAMQQALEALHNTQNALLFVSGSIEQFIISNMTADAHDDADKAITALREALAEQDIDCPCGSECVKCSPRVLLAEQAEQEPVAWGRVFDGDIIDCVCPEEHALNEGDYTIPLYTHPVRTKDLTDDELADACGWKLGDPMYEWVVDIGRWAIAADREKNK